MSDVIQFRGHKGPVQLVEYTQEEEDHAHDFIGRAYERLQLEREFAEWLKTFDGESKP